jgi:hypothetical protein
MDHTLSTAPEWAQAEFALTDLGDARRTRRLTRVASALAQCPSGTLTQACPEWKELKAAYRLFDSEGVSHPAIIREHCQRTEQWCRQPGEYLLIEDGSCLDFSSHRQTRGLGRIGNDRGLGLMLHTTLALRVEQWQLDQTPEVTVVGMLGQKSWARTGSSARAKKEKWRQRMKRPRESECWAEVLTQMERVPAPAQWIYIADRESDIYEVFERCDAQGSDYIVRAQHARALAQEDQSVFEAVAQGRVLGRFSLDLRTRGDCLERSAPIEVRSRKVKLQGVWRPGGKRPDVEVNVVEAREVDAPAGVEPIRWILLTSLPCETFLQARRVISRYARRWVIEEYHKALKSGAQIEASQLASAERLQALLGVLALVALRLLNTKLLARSRPEEPVALETLGEEAKAILQARFGKPKGGWTHASLLVAIARLGGFLARRGDGSPGWLTIWRGWQRLMTMAEGIQSLQPQFRNSEAKRCG